MSLKRIVITEFIQRFGEKPQYVVRAPGRVNLIGEHTDYNDGFVMPMAIDREMWIALRPRQDKAVAIYSLDKQETSVIDLAALERKQPNSPRPPPDNIPNIPLLQQIPMRTSPTAIFNKPV